MAQFIHGERVGRLGRLAIGCSAGVLDPAGTRILLDHLLVSNGLSPDQVRGYDSVCVSHGDVAMRVLNGFADAALGIRSAAMAMGLDFIPLVEEPYELVYPSRYRGHPAMEALVEMAEDPEWRSRVEAMGGYLWP